MAWGKNLKALFTIFFLRFYLFLDRGEGKEKKKDRNANVWLPFTHSLLETWLITQACALTGNRTSDPLVHRPMLSPLSYTSQGHYLSHESLAAHWNHLWFFKKHGCNESAKPIL